MKNPFTVKLHARIATLERQLAASQQAERDTAAARDRAVDNFAQVEPSIEQRAGDRAIELIASTGVLAPIACAGGKTGSANAPRSKKDFLDTYSAIADPDEASAYYDEHSAILG